MKFIRLTIPIFFAICLYACSNNIPEQSSHGVKDALTATDSNTALISTETPTESEQSYIEPDDMLLTVNITLPAYVFEGESMDSFNADAYAAEQGLLSAKMNDDGSVTVTMTKARHQEVLEDVAAQIDAIFEQQVIEQPYIIEINHNNDYSQIIVRAVRSDYENAFDFTHLAVGFPSMIYQSLLDMEPHVEVLFIDSLTSEVIFSCVFPDSLSE